ncbi:hypothetical protein KORDIASMS9_02200 [Kordia sp. SMS9]|nr:hypothetical protein KORDIASMS9_02200 [Kordia sp. SMS9]
MFALVAKLYSEDINKKDFCERESLNYHTFSYWVRRYRSFHGLVKGTSTSTDDTASQNKFIPINIENFFGWFNAATSLLEPLYDVLTKELLQSNYLSSTLKGDAERAIFARNRYSLEKALY